MIQPCSLQPLNFIFGSFMSHPTGIKLFVWLILMGYYGSPGWPGPHLAARDGLRLVTILSPPCAEIIRCRSHTWFKHFPLCFILPLLSMYGAYECLPTESTGGHWVSCFATLCLIPKIESLPELTGQQALQVCLSPAPSPGIKDSATTPRPPSRGVLGM